MKVYAVEIYFKAIDVRTQFCVTTDADRAYIIKDMVAKKTNAQVEVKEYVADGSGVIFFD